ncbi:hypothetical protein PC114_g26854 [Phytophthora cactorum]|nr:hypothetical protein PC114_g26854 [Phytophthora cactorum]
MDLIRDYYDGAQARPIADTFAVSGTGRFTALLTDNHVSGRRAPRSCSDAGIALRDVARQRPDAGCRS